MVTPINPQRHTTPATEFTPTAPAQRTSAGVGDTPTTLNSASPSQQSAQPEGYIVPFLNWCGGWISWIFKKICCCCYPAAPNQPAQDRPAQGATPLSEPSIPPIAIPRESVRREVQVREAFARFPDLTRSVIYRDIGISRARFWSIRPYELIGQIAADNDYRLLEQHMDLA